MTRQHTPISYVSGISDTPLKGQTIGDCFDETVSRFPDREALLSLHQGLRYTWRELQAAVDQAARALLALGVAKGDRVGIWSPNCAEWTITQFATAKIGAVLVNINPSYRTHELEYALKQSGASTLILQGKFKASDYVATLAELAPELREGGPGTFKNAKLPELKRVVCLDGDRALTGMFSWQSMLAHADEVSAEHLAEVQATLQFDDPINIQYTSGTTGAPKGATLSHHNILNNGFFVARTMALTEEDRMVIPVPLYHCFGMVMGNLGCVTHGATMIYPGDGFDPEATLRGLRGEGHRPLRRAHHVHRRAGAAQLRELRPLPPAHRHHGGLHLPHRGDAQADRPHEHEGRHHLLRDDRDQPGELPDPDRRPPGEARHHRGHHPPPPGGEAGEPGDRRRGGTRRDRRALHPGLQRDARLLEQRGGHRQGHRQRRLDAHRRPGHHG